MNGREGAADQAITGPREYVNVCCCSLAVQMLRQNYASNVLGSLLLSLLASASSLQRTDAACADVPDTYENLYAFFIGRVRDRLHVILCFSPVGATFARRAQQVRTLRTCA